MIGSITVSTEALRTNATLLRDLIAPSKAAFVVKGNAYGHGLCETALAIEQLASKFCVYSVDEAVALRDGGITAPILVLGPIPHDALKDAIDARAEIALWDTSEYVHHVADAARKAHRRIKTHVKINTGLNRLGLEPNELADAVEDYAKLSDLELVGLFSHLAAAEEIDSPYTHLQLERFNNASESAASAFANTGGLPTRHIAASAAAMLWPETRLDMVRFGIALYGLWPSPQTREAANGGKLRLVPALSYHTQLVESRHVAAGDAIGYGTTFHAPRGMQIGVLPLGYADGIPRLLSNRGSVLVSGARCAIVGRVAMNMTFVDLTNAPQAKAGDRVTLIGTDGHESITADDWATWSETINYEIVTRLPSTLTRTFT